MTIIANPHPPYVFVEYPKWKYHPDKKPLVVDDYDQEKALGPDWYDTPGEAETALAALQKKVGAATK